MKQDILKSQVNLCLSCTPFYSLATLSNSKPWSCTLWFANDEAYNFYFISPLSSKHIQNIMKDENISLSMFNPAEAENGNAVGIQLTGKANILTEENEIRNTYKIYFKKQYPETGIDADGRTEDDFVTGKTEWRFVKVTPTEIWYFDNRYYEEKRQKFM